MNKATWMILLTVLLAALVMAQGCDSPTAPKVPNNNDDAGCVDCPPPPPPPPPPPQTVYKEVTIGGASLEGMCPAWVKNGGDREFGGHGPTIRIDVEMSAYKNTNNKLSVKVGFRATETKPDNTTADGYWEYPVYTAPVGWVIDEILSDNSSYMDYVDTNHDYDYPPILGSNFVTFIKVRGDTEGNDVGNCTTDDTHISRIDYRAVQIRIRKL